MIHCISRPILLGMHAVSHIMLERWDDILTWVKKVGIHCYSVWWDIYGRPM